MGKKHVDIGLATNLIIFWEIMGGSQNLFQYKVFYVQLRKNGSMDQLLESVRHASQAQQSLVYIAIATRRLSAYPDAAPDCEDIVEWAHSEAEKINQEASQLLTCWYTKQEHNIGLNLPGML